MHDDAMGLNPVQVIAGEVKIRVGVSLFGRGLGILFLNPRHIDGVNMRHDTGKVFGLDKFDLMLCQETFDIRLHFEYLGRDIVQGDLLVVFHQIA